MPDENIRAPVLTADIRKSVLDEARRTMKFYETYKPRIADPMKHEWYRLARAYVEETET